MIIEPELRNQVSVSQLLDVAEHLLRYIEDLNTEYVWYLNGRLLNVHYSDADLNMEHFCFGF